MFFHEYVHEMFFFWGEDVRVFVKKVIRQVGRGCAGKQAKKQALPFNWRACSLI